MLKLWPVQEGSQESLRLERHTEEEGRIRFLAEIFGWRCLGWIFAQSRKDREYILSAEEVGQMAAVQDEFGNDSVTGVVSMSTDGDVHFEAFQVNITKDLCCYPLVEASTCGDGSLCSERHQAGPS